MQEMNSRARPLLKQTCRAIFGVHSDLEIESTATSNQAYAETITSLSDPDEEQFQAQFPN